MWVFVIVMYLDTKFGDAWGCLVSKPNVVSTLRFVLNKTNSLKQSLTVITQDVKLEIWIGHSIQWRGFEAMKVIKLFIDGWRIFMICYFLRGCSQHCSSREEALTRFNIGLRKLKWLCDVYDLRGSMLLVFWKDLISFENFHRIALSRPCNEAQQKGPSRCPTFS